MSESRRCDIWKATDSKWYMLLGNFEYAEDDMDCTAYGPFVSEDAAWEHQGKHFTNPGCAEVDDSCTMPPPENPKIIRRAFR